MHTIRRIFTALLATCMSLAILLTLMVGTASAHAKVTQSDPGIGSTVSTAPSKITVTALENINPDPKKSNLFVYSPAGELISQGNATVSLTNPKQMSINVKASGNGIYVVHWVTVSADDGDPDEGAYTFTVGKAASVSPAPAPKPTTSSTTSNPNPLVVGLITGIIAILIGLGAGFAIGRSGQRVASAGTSTSTITQDPTTTRR